MVFEQKMPNRIFEVVKKREQVYEYTVPMVKLEHINEEKGKFFFSPGTTKFFSSRWGARAYVKKGDAYFVTSEQYHGREGSNPRRYTVRKMNLETGDTDTIGEFQAYSTLPQAETALFEKMKEV